MLAGAQAEEDLVHPLRELAHRYDGQPGGTADDGGQHNQPDFVSTDERA
jgi:hypothetical protein